MPMSLTGMVCRPSYEANSLRLQVTQGCSYNKCAFCNMYPDVPFSVCPMEQAEADIEEATRCCTDVERVFLERGDAYVLSVSAPPSNIVPMQGRLPKHKQAMIGAVREKRKPLRRHLDEWPRRGGEGSILNR